MAKICPKCNNEVPKFYFDKNGKKHNCQRRKYCFICSPFGQHNTIKLEELKNGRGKCKLCGKPVQRNSNSSKCYSCFFNQRQSQMILKVQDIVGDKCWICGYNRTWRNIAFHHVDKSQKLFGLTTREFVGYKWSRVFIEMQKCVVVCMNCHGEIHDNIISDKEISKLHTEKWRP
jgi:hypothetical protein